MRRQEIKSVLRRSSLGTYLKNRSSALHCVSNDIAKDRGYTGGHGATDATTSLTNCARHTAGQTNHRSSVHVYSLGHPPEAIGDLNSDTSSDGVADLRNARHSPIRVAVVTLSHDMLVPTECRTTSALLDLGEGITPDLLVYDSYKCNRFVADPSHALLLILYMRHF